MQKNRPIQYKYAVLTYYATEVFNNQNVQNRVHNVKNFGFKRFLRTQKCKVTVLSRSFRQNQIYIAVLQDITHRETIFKYKQKNGPVSRGFTDPFIIKLSISSQSFYGRHFCGAFCGVHTEYHAYRGRKSYRERNRREFNLKRHIHNF